MAYPNDWQRRRKSVYRRDNYKCQRCGRKGGKRGRHELHAHHKVPVSKGGSHDMKNLVTLCDKCHESKHGHPIGRKKENIAVKGAKAPVRATASITYLFTGLVLLSLGLLLMITIIGLPLGYPIAKKGMQYLRRA